MQNKSWCILLNPRAGGGKTEKKWPSIEAALVQAGIDFSLFKTTKKGHATTLAQAAIGQGFRHILGIGGDGTNNEICDGILSQKFVKSSDIRYTLLPYGRGNDWARTYGFTGKVADFIKRVEGGQTVLQDAGKAVFMQNGKQKIRHFVNVAGMAYDGYLVKTSEATSKGIQNHLHYQLMILKCLSSYKAPEGRVHFNGQVVQDKFYLINVGLCKYSGGGMQLVPHAVPNDGLFALTIAGNVPKWDVLLQTPKFYAGTLGKHKLVQLHQTKNVEVEHLQDENIHLELDGEYVGTTPARFEILSDALRILI